MHKNIDTHDVETWDNFFRQYWTGTIDVLKGAYGKFIVIIAQLKRRLKCQHIVHACYFQNTIQEVKNPENYMQNLWNQLDIFIELCNWKTSWFLVLQKTITSCDSRQMITSFNYETICMILESYNSKSEL